MLCWTTQISTLGRRNSFPQRLGVLAADTSQLHPPQVSWRKLPPLKYTRPPVPMQWLVDARVQRPCPLALFRTSLKGHPSFSYLWDWLKLLLQLGRPNILACPGLRGFSAKTGTVLDVHICSCTTVQLLLPKLVSLALESVFPKNIPPKTSCTESQHLLQGTDWQQGF